MELMEGRISEFCLSLPPCLFLPSRAAGGPGRAVWLLHAGAGEQSDLEMYRLSSQNYGGFSFLCHLSHHFLQGLLQVGWFSPPLYGPVYI